jgi:hypothetical protein
MNTHFINKKLAHLLGYAGLIPFVLLTLACWIVHPDWLGDFIKGQLAYGIVILSFLGGMHWGATMLTNGLSNRQTWYTLGWSVTPPLLGWFATMVGGFGFAVLMAGFIGAYQVDKRLFAWYGMPAWLIELRFRLTSVIVPMLALTVIAANVRG